MARQLDTAQDYQIPEPTTKQLTHIKLWKIEPFIYLEIGGETAPVVHWFGGVIERGAFVPKYSDQMEVPLQAMKSFLKKTPDGSATNLEFIESEFLKFLEANGKIGPGVDVTV